MYDRRFSLLIILFLPLVSNGNEPPDSWVDSNVTHSFKVGTRSQFAALKAEIIIGRLTVFWRSDLIPTCTDATIYYSHDQPGHWPARDWRKLPMRRRQHLYDVKVPVSDIDVPMVYYVVVETPSGPIASPTRVISPRVAGMEKASTVFWPFIEGYENGMGNWTITGGALSNEARSGGKALEVSVTSAAQPATISTTKVRGWHFINQRARAIRLWLKADSPATARFILTTDARTKNQKHFTSRIVAKIEREWQSVDLPLDSFKVALRSRIDQFTIQFSAGSRANVLIDDLQYLGRWRIKGL